MATPTTSDPPVDDKPDGPAPLILPGLGVDSEVTERAIPVRTADLRRLVLAEADNSPVERQQLGQLIKLLQALFHHEYQSWLEELKDLYAPFDPDADVIDLGEHSRHVTDRGDEAFLKPFEAALLRANYRPLKLEVIEQAIAAPNEKGLTYEPNFGLFEHLKVYVRGSTYVSRLIRNIKTKFQKREVLHPGYRRFIVLLKFKAGQVIDDYVRDDVLYIRMFKDVPHVDLEMHLPEQGTKVKMRLIDKAQIASPLIVFPSTLALKALGFFVGVMTVMPQMTIGSLMLAPVTAGINSFMGFKRAKQRHLSTMIRHLYYLTMANNASVITNVIDAAEDEEFKEALLAYYLLWRSERDGDTEPWTPDQLDAAVEAFLKGRCGVDVDFEIGDALRKLVRLGLVHLRPGDRLAACPIDRALPLLDQQWDDIFRFNNRPGPTPEPPLLNKN
jgi:hypothetical protein